MERESFSGREFEPKPRLTLRELLVQLRERLLEQVAKTIMGEDKELKDYEKQVNSSISISKAAGDFFRTLAPHSLHQPDKNYRHEEAQSKLQADTHQHIERLQAIQKLRLTSPAIYKAYKKALLSEKEPGASELWELAPDESGIMQGRWFTTEQDDSPNIIEEAVYNNLSDQRNTAWANLIMRNRDTGLKLDFDGLLPKGYQFVPEALVKQSVEFDEEAMALKYTPIPISLAVYEGAGNSNGSFYEQSSARVAYGNLAQKGGILSLLHEIAHSWQSTYYEPYGRSQFDKFRDAVGLKLNLLNDFNNQTEQGEMAVEEYQTIFTRIQKDLREDGIEIEQDRFLDSAATLQEGEARFSPQYAGEKCAYIIKSEKLDKLVSDYEREERDAWAHALRVVRFLRRRGFDLEPGLKTLKDVKEHVDPCLGSYQQHVEQMVESSTKGVRFARSKSH